MPACNCSWGGSGLCPCFQRQWAWPYSYGGTYLCWCGSYHPYGTYHPRPVIYQPPVVWPVSTPQPKKPKPQRKPGALKKEDLDKVQKILKGK